MSKSGLRLFTRTQFPHGHLFKELHINTDNFVLTAICTSFHWLYLEMTHLDGEPPKNDHILKAQHPVLQQMVKLLCISYNLWIETQHRHEWIISLLLFTTLILSSIWFVFFKLLKQTDKIYISLNPTILTWCISSPKAKLLRPEALLLQLLYPFW